MRQWEDRAQESYDRVAEPYAELTRSAVEDDPYMAGAYAMLATLALACPQATATAADIGCGPGWWVEYLSTRGVRATGVDLSEAMLGLAREHAPQAAFCLGSVLALPLRTHAVAARVVHVRTAPRARS